MDYEEKVLVFPNGKKKLSIVFKDKKYSLLSDFLGSELQNFNQFFIEHIDSVLNEKTDLQKVSGNVIELKITPEKTTLFNSLARTDEEYERTSCEIDTKELRQLIDEWSEKVKNFKDSNNS